MYSSVVMRLFGLRKFLTTGHQITPLVRYRTDTSRAAAQLTGCCG